MERCPNCNSRLDLRLEPLEFENDNTPDLPTIAYEVQGQLCNNPDCVKYGQIVNKIRHKRN